jgi:hypothetical protein
MDFESEPADNKSVGILQSKAEMANLFGPYCLSMVKFTIRGASGLVSPLIRSMIPWSNPGMLLPMRIS